MSTRPLCGVTNLQVLSLHSFFLPLSLPAVDESLGSGQMHFVKVSARSPGLQAESCWAGPAHCFTNRMARGRTKDERVNLRKWWKWKERNGSKYKGVHWLHSLFRPIRLWLLCFFTLQLNFFTFVRYRTTGAKFMYCTVVYCICCR